MRGDQRTFLEFLADRQAWSERTFGLGSGAEGVCRHIEKELKEIRTKPGDLEEWVDVMLLAFDGAARAGFSPEEILFGIFRKHEKNTFRKWPMPTSQDESVEHIKDGAPGETI